MKLKRKSTRLKRSERKLCHICINQGRKPPSKAVVRCIKCGKPVCADCSCLCDKPVGRICDYCSKEDEMFFFFLLNQMRTPRSESIKKRVISLSKKVECEVCKKENPHSHPNDAVGKCANCGASACNLHSSVIDGARLCVDCQEKRQDED